MSEIISLRAKKLPRDPGPAGWNEILPAAPDAIRQEGSEPADLVIIGAGFAGLSAAHRALAHHPSARVVVLEAARLASGPAGRNSGFMIDLPHDLSSASYAGANHADRRQIRDNRLAIEFAADLARRAELGPEVFAQSGKINGAATARGDAHNRDYARHLAELGEASEIYDAAKMKAITGTDYYRSGLFTPGAAMIQPAAYIRGIGALATRLGAKIYEHSPALALSHAGGLWHVKTPLGEVSAPQVILAVNGHLNTFGLLPGRLMHVFTYASMSAPLSAAQEATLGGEPFWGLTPSDPLGSTLRKIQTPLGARLLIRNRFTYDPGMEVSARRLASVARTHDRTFAARFGMLQGLEMSHRWGGRLCLAWNNVAAFGEEAQGLFIAGCHNGLGTTKGTFGGMMAADLAFGITSEPLEDLLNDPLPRRLPPAPLDWIGANARMKFGEYRAGSDL